MASAAVSASAISGGVSASAVSAAALPLRTLTSSFLECDVPVSSAPPTGAPGGVVAHYTSYIVVFPAACATREWIATYTVGEYCPSECDATHRQRIEAPDYIPPNFVVTTVVCDVCAEKTQTITCPNALGTAEAVIHGDGITATVVVTDEVQPPHYTLPASGEVGGHPPNSLPMAPPLGITYGATPGASVSQVRVAGTPAYSGYQPLVTAGAPRSVGLKIGLVLLTSLSLAAFNMLT